MKKIFCLILFVTFLLINSKAWSQDVEPTENWMITFTYTDTLLPEHAIEFVCNTVKPEIIPWLEREANKYQQILPFYSISCLTEQFFLPPDLLGTCPYCLNDYAVSNFLENSLDEIRNAKYVSVVYYLDNPDSPFIPHCYNSKYDFYFFRFAPGFPDPLYPPLDINRQGETLIHEFMHKLGATDKYYDGIEQACKIDPSTGQEYSGYDIMCHSIGNPDEGYHTPPLSELIITEPTAKEIGWLDSDGDGASDWVDDCPNDPGKTDPGICGCGVPDVDTDSDGTFDCNDNCPNDPNKTEYGVCGCGVPDTDSDGDHLEDCDDLCPNDPNKIQPGVCGCGVPDTDTDSDGTLNCNDGCPNDLWKTDPGICGCGVADVDTDTDGTFDCNDNCPNDPNKIDPGVCGCGIPDTDSDGDGILDCNDNCDNSIDTDGDGLSDCDDLCPNDSNKTQPGTCGCGVADTDTDSDGTLDCNDNCPNDPSKIQPGTCGCGITDTDTDLDGTPDCTDGCPNDINKTQPGICGCGFPDTDSDGDGIPDCNDGCNNSIDSDGDGINDCDDLCPNDLNKTVPGTCGCSAADTDSDGDGTLDCMDVNDDGDGLPDGEEQGPDRNNPNYDGNGDGIADYLQGNVASFHTYNNQNYITIVSPSGTSIRNCKAVNIPSTSNPPQNVDFTHGFFGFSIDGVDPGDAVAATMYFPAGETFNTYYKYGPTPDNPINHWYEFLHNGQTGANMNGNIVTLHFVDGLRGDDDLTTNGTISDIGAPGVMIDSGDSGDSGRPVVSSSGGGGGGCFISTVTGGSSTN